MLEPQELVFDVVTVGMISNLIGQSNLENEEIGNEASQRRQPEVIQVEEMQLQAINTLRPRGVVSSVKAGAEIEKRRMTKLLMESLRGIQIYSSRCTTHRTLLEAEKRWS